MYLRDCARHVRPDRIRTDKMAVFRPTLREKKDGNSLIWKILFKKHTYLCGISQ